MPFINLFIQSFIQSVSHSVITSSLRGYCPPGTMCKDGRGPMVVGTQWEADPRPKLTRGDSAGEPAGAPQIFKCDSGEE